MAALPPVVYAPPFIVFRCPRDRRRTASVTLNIISIMSSVPAYRILARLAVVALMAVVPVLALVTTPDDAVAAPRLHLRLLRASPAADTVLTTPPADLRLWFSERPELKVTTVRLTGPGGAVELGELARADASDAPIVAPVKGQMVPGAYTVAWRTMASDGHVLNGTVNFRLTGATSR